MHLACWAHCRGDFNGALQALPKQAWGPDQLAAQFMALIGKLYAVESRGRDLKMWTEQLLEQREAPQCAGAQADGARLSVTFAVGL